MASSASRRTKVPAAPNPGIAGTWPALPVARISRSYGSTSPVASATDRAPTSIPAASVFSQHEMLFSRYHASGSR